MIPGPRLQAWWVRAREAWPDIVVSEERFSRHIATLVSKEAVGFGALEDLHVEDVYLAIAAVDNVPKAVEALDACYLSGLRPALAATGLHMAQIDDVLQDVRKMLLLPGTSGTPGLLTYRGQAKMLTWLQVVAVREGVRLLKRTGREVGFDDARAVEEAATGDDPELAFLKEQYRAEFRVAFSEALASMNVKSRMLLRMHYVNQSGLEELALLHRVHRATIARWLEKARDSLLLGTKKLLAAKLNIDHAEVESVMRLIQSHLDLHMSLRKLLPNKEPRRQHKQRR